MRSFQLGICAITTVIACSLSGCVDHIHGGFVNPVNNAALLLGIKKDESYKQTDNWKVLMAMMTLDHDLLPLVGADRTLFDWTHYKSTGNQEQDYMAILSASPRNSVWAYEFYDEYPSMEMQVALNEKTVLGDDHRIGPWADTILALLKVTSSPDNLANIDTVYDLYRVYHGNMSLTSVSEDEFKQILYHGSVNKQNYTDILKQLQKKEADELASRTQRGKIRVEINPTNQAERAVQNQLDKLFFNENIVFSNQGNPLYEDDFRVDDREIGLPRIALIGIIRNNIERCNKIGEDTYNPKATVLCMRELVNAIPEWARAANDRTISDRAWGNAAYSVVETHHSTFTDWIKYAKYEQSRGW